MIYEIEFKENLNISQIEKFDILENLGNFCMSNKNFYLHTNSIIDENSPISSYLSKICLINESNYNSIQNYILRNWCKEKLIKDEFNKFIKSGEIQERLDAIMNYLDILEELKKEGDEAIGTKENTDKNARKNTRRRAKYREENGTSGKSVAEAI